VLPVVQKSSEKRKLLFFLPRLLLLLPLALEQTCDVARGSEGDGRWGAEQSRAERSGISCRPALFGPMPKQGILMKLLC